MSARTCSQCSKGMDEGFYCCDKYYCSEECLEAGTGLTHAQWVVRHYDDECYWTQWEAAHAG